MVNIETRVHYGNLAAMDSSVQSSVYLAKQSVNESSGRGPGIVVFDADEKDFSESIQGVENFKSELNSNAKSNKIDDTHDNITVAADLVSDSENHFDALVKIASI